MRLEEQFQANCLSNTLTLPIINCSHDLVQLGAWLSSQCLIPRPGLGENRQTSMQTTRILA